MVLIEEAGVDASKGAVVLKGAGCEDANGLYLATGKMWHEAPIYENDKKCLLSREPHKNQKGETTFGWIVGQDRKPLYAIESASVRPPASGWRKFKGVHPAPTLKLLESIAEAAKAAASGMKEEGNALFGERRYGEAEAKWTRALALMEHVGVPAMEVALYSNRAEARLRQSLWDSALDDAKAALKLRPSHDKALLRGAVAARELGMYGAAQDFAQHCVDTNPRLLEGKEMLAEILHLRRLQLNLQPDRGVAARKKLAEAIQREVDDGLGQVSKQLGIKDSNSKKGFKAFNGYGDERAATAKEERPPLSSLPYHQQGLPEGSVKLMDKFFQERRDKQDAQELADKQAAKNYEIMKKDYAERTADAIMEGREQPISELLPVAFAAATEAATQTGERRLATTGASHALALKEEDTKRFNLSQRDIEEIDSLFA